MNDITLLPGYDEWIDELNRKYYQFDENNSGVDFSDPSIPDTCTCTQPHIIEE